MTTLSTCALLVLEATMPQAVNAQTAIVQTVDYSSDQQAGTIQSEALAALSSSANLPVHIPIALSENPAVDATVDSAVDATVDLSSNLAVDATENEAIDRSVSQFATPENQPQHSIASGFNLTDRNDLTDRDRANHPSQEAIDSTATFRIEPANFSELEPLSTKQMGAGTENAVLQETTPAAQTSDPAAAPAEGEAIAQGGSALLGAPFIQLQGAVVVQGDEFSARARVTASYAITPNLLVGGTLDAVTGEAFADSPESGLNLNELYVAVSPSEIPTLRFAAGLLDYTSYFDRNSFAKDGVTQFFNPIFQTNPALAAAGLSSRPGVLVNWSVTDNLELRAAGFSSRRDLSDFAIDGFAAEAAVRIQNLILRGTYITALDAGDDSGFREIFQFDRGGDFGLRSGDREQAYGINAEYFVPSIRLGLFARYGWYDNLDLGRGGETYSFGFNLLDLLMRDDRLGLAYGRDLSDEGLRQQRDDKLPDVLELFYDARLLPYLRAGITAQARNSFSETILGFRLRADLSLSDLGRIFR